MNLTYTRHSSQFKPASQQANHKIEIPSSATTFHIFSAIFIFTATGGLSRFPVTTNYTQSGSKNNVYWEQMLTNSRLLSINCINTDI